MVRMFQKDWLLRQIEMISAMVAQLVLLRRNGDFQEAEQTIDEAYREMFGLDPRLVGILPIQFLNDKIMSGDRFDGHRGLALAVLLREDAQNRLDQGRIGEVDTLWLRSLAVFLAVAKVGALPPEHRELYDTESMLERIDPDAMPGEMKYDLFQFYEDDGQFARAEDVLYELIEASPSPEVLIEEGIDFYEWLLLQSDEDLANGNLPRAEVAEGLERLCEIRLNSTRE